MNEETAILIVEQRKTISEESLAALHHVSLKTIRRILRGESWSEATGIVPKPPEPVRQRALPSAVGVALARLEITDAVRDHFGFERGRPLAWAVYDGWDGLVHVATDGLIAWRSMELCTAVRAVGGDELPTFGASALLNRSVGDPLGTEDVPAKYLCLARARSLSIREAIGDDRLAYLTASKSCRSADEFSVPMAVVMRS